MGNQGFVTERGTYVLNKFTGFRLAFMVGMQFIIVKGAVLNLYTKRYINYVMFKSTK